MVDKLIHIYCRFEPTNQDVIQVPSVIFFSPMYFPKFSTCINYPVFNPIIFPQLKSFGYHVEVVSRRHPVDHCMQHI